MHRKAHRKNHKSQNGQASVGIFGKKEKPKPTATTTMLYTLNRDMIAQQQAQSRQLSEYADSLAIVEK